MRPLGHMGTGEGSPRIRTPEHTGVLRGIVQAAAIPYHGPPREPRPSLIAPEGRRRYTRSPRGGGTVEFFAFDQAYLDRLRAGDPPTEHHFFAYFGQFLRIRLRARRLPHDKIDDLVQETFSRVLEVVRRPGGVRVPKGFGAFVAATNRNIVLEYYRSCAKDQPMDNGHTEIPDKVLDLHGLLVTKETVAHVRRILLGMPKRDRDILRAIFLEEKEKDAVCRVFGVKRDYLRVLVHRAKGKFRSLYGKQ